MEALTFDKLEYLLPENGDGPLAVLEIDSVIMDPGPRTLRILQEAARFIPEMRTVIERIDAVDIGWNLKQVLERYPGLADETKGRINAFWEQRFFTDQYVLHDHPYPGAGDFLYWLQRRGVALVFLTGRDKANMSAGTLESFRRNGLPCGNETRFFFKPINSFPDRAFRQGVLETIGALGTVTVAVESDPGNANLIRSMFPGALVLLREWESWSDPEKPLPDIIRFNQYPIP